MIDANAIRDAIGAIADEAHPPLRIRAAIEARYRRHHQRRLLLRVAGAAATTAVAGVGGVGVYRLTQRDDSGFPDIAGGPGGGWLQAQPRWRPTWLPDGFGLTGVGAVVDGDKAVVASRIWTRPQRANEQTTPLVSLTTGWSDTYAPRSAPARTEQVDVNGVPGEFSTFDDNGGGWLTWQPPGEPKLTLSVGLSDAELERVVAMRVAKSLRRDPRAIAVGPRPGWLPADFATLPWMFTLGGLDGTWAQNITVRTAATDMTVAAGPSVGQAFNREGAQTVHVRGADAWLGPASNELFLPLPDGFNVLVTTSAPQADLVRVAENFDFGPVPDMTWYGSR